MTKALMSSILFLFILSGCISVDKQVVIDRQSKQYNDFDKSTTFISAELAQLPTTKKLDVPFVMQAPFANWDEHSESCEEAGILLTHYYYLGKSLDKETANTVLRSMVAFQKEKYGAELDIYSNEMGVLASDYFGYDKYRVFQADMENLRSEIARGNPVIVPTTAKYLKPDKSDYPEMGYHVIVLVGYDEGGFYANDPGTVTGENCYYRNQTIQNAIADYDNKVLVLR